MYTSEERAIVTEINDRLIEPHVQQDEARRADDRDRAPVEDRLRKEWDPRKGGLPTLYRTG